MRGGYSRGRFGRRAALGAAFGAALTVGTWGADRLLRLSEGQGVRTPGQPVGPGQHAVLAAGTGRGVSTVWADPVPVRESAQTTLPGTGRSVALTFDDGPHPEHTPEVLRVLRAYDVLATFFVLGENAERHPDLVRAIAAGGHLVGNHSWGHPQLPQLSETEVRWELATTSDLLADLLGAPPGWARAPYGAWDDPSLAVCADLGMVPLGWSVDTEDWARPGSDAIAAAVLDGVEPGAVVLMHDGGGDRSQTVAALEQVLPRLLDDGYRPILPA